MTLPLNPDGTFTVVGADPTGTQDNHAPIQDAIDYVFATYVGGKLNLPQPGSYHIKSPLTLKGGVELQGRSRMYTNIVVDGDYNVLNFDSTCNYAAVRDIFLQGFMNASAKQNAVNVARNAPVNIERCHIWGGNSALYTQGIDGTVEDCFIAGWVTANIISNGANWYKRVKCDGGPQHIQFGFYQGTPVAGIAGPMENHFTAGCDFSGNFDHSIYISDGNTNTAITFFSDCITSCPVSVMQASHTGFAAHEFGSSVFNKGAGTCGIGGASKAFAPMRVPTDVAIGSSCVNISH